MRFLHNGTNSLSLSLSFSFFLRISLPLSLFFSFFPSLFLSLSPTLSYTQFSLSLTHTEYNHGLYVIST